MGIMDSVFSGGKQQAGQDLKQGYEQANQYLQPYYDGGTQDYNTYRGRVAGQGQQLDQYGNPANQFWNNASLNPDNYYDQLMGGYSESPMAKNEQANAMRAANQGAAASGLLGSGAYFNGLQQNAADISSRDMQNYYNNILSANDRQFGYAQNFQGQQNDYMNRMRGLADIGYYSAGQMGQNAIGAAQAQAQSDEGEGDMWGNMLGTGLNMAGNYMTGGWTGVAQGLTGGY